MIDEALRDLPADRRQALERAMRGWPIRDHRELADAIEHMPPIRRVPPRSAPKVGRNDPCPCDSGAKFKKCCGR